MGQNVKIYCMGLPLMFFIGFMAACGEGNENSRFFAEKSSSLTEASAEKVIQESKPDFIENLLSNQETHTWEQEAVVDPGVDQNKTDTILATCSGRAVAPWYSGGSTHARGIVTCSSGATIPATVTLERSTGTSVGSYNSTKSGTSMTWTFSAAGCGHSLQYRTRFVSNGVVHLSAWSDGCT